MTALVDNPLTRYVYSNNGNLTVPDPLPGEIWSSWTSMNEAILAVQKTAAEHKATAAISAAKERYVGVVYGIPADALTADASLTDDGNAGDESTTSVVNGLYADYVASMQSAERTALAQTQSLKSDLNDALLAAQRLALRRL